MEPRKLLLRLALGTTVATASFAMAQAQDCPDGVVTLTGLTNQGNFPYPELIETWEAANPCVDVEFTEVPFSQLADQISVLSASDNPPDVFVYDGPNTQSYAAAGILLPLDDYLPEAWYDDILPATLAEHSYQGHVYSPGVEQTTIALYYNKTLTDAAGVTPPTRLEDAWTWPEAIEAFQKCRDTANDPNIWGLAPTRFGNGQPGIVYNDLLYQRSAGDPNADPDSSLYKTYWAESPDGTEVDGWLNTPEAIEALKVYQSIFDQLELAPKAGIPNAFVDGKACFYIDTPILGNALLRDPVVEWGVSPMPYFVTPIVHSGSTTIGVSAKTEIPDVAAQFVLDITSGEYVKAILNRRTNIPTLKSLFPEFPMFQEYPMKIFVDQLEHWAQPRPPSPHFAQFDKIVTEALRDIAFGADPEERINLAVRRLTPFLSD